jgi:hypothetical protein
VDTRVECSTCGRKFNEDRIEKHEDSCAKINKVRPAFDGAKQRVIYIQL